MKIEEKINKYLKEGKMKRVSRKEALDRVLKVIKSAKTMKQIETATKMAANFYQMYGETFIGDLKKTLLISGFYGETEKQILDAIDDQIKRINHLARIKKN